MIDNTYVFSKLFDHVTVSYVHIINIVKNMLNIE